MKKCKVCEKEKDDIFFPKWKKTCKSCCVEQNKVWKLKNKKIIDSCCIDCNQQYKTIVYSTEIINTRCRKCSVNNNKPLLTSKICKICNIEKDISIFYKNYKVCKKCLFNKRNDRYRERLNSDNLFKLKHNLKVYIRKCLSNINKKKNGVKTITILGCSFEEFRIYLESKFEPWMNWENKGIYNGEFNYGWDIDHIIPISSVDTEYDIIRLNHYTNLQPLCSKINRDIKKDKINYEN